MQSSVKSKSLTNIIFMFLYMESCCSNIKIDRDKQDKIDSLNQRNCDGISQGSFAAQRCKCTSADESSVASTNTVGIACVSNTQIDRSKII